VKPSIGFIGLGLMGKPMSTNLLKAGYPLTVWNRTASRADDLVAAGATLANSPREVAEHSDFLVTIVSDPPALEEVLWGGANSGALVGLKAGATYMDSSTVSPELACKIAAACATQQVRFIDAPVTGGDWGAKKGELVFMMGGDAEAIKDAEPILGVMGKKWFHLGPNGAGQTIKLAMNAILALEVEALAEAKREFKDTLVGGEDGSPFQGARKRLRSAYIGANQAPVECQRSGDSGGIIRGCSGNRFVARLSQ